MNYRTTAARAKAKADSDCRNATSTKRGPGRVHKSGTKRNTSAIKRAGVYGLGLLVKQQQRNQERMAKLNPLRDEHGAYTLIGKTGFSPRRVWLAGISAQRGY